MRHKWTLQKFLLRPLKTLDWLEIEKLFPRKNTVQRDLLHELAEGCNAPVKIQKIRCIAPKYRHDASTVVAINTKFRKANSIYKMGYASHGGEGVQIYVVEGK